MFAFLFPNGEEHAGGGHGQSLGETGFASFDPQEYIGPFVISCLPVAWPAFRLLPVFLPSPLWFFLLHFSDSCVFCISNEACHTCAQHVRHCDRFFVCMFPGSDDRARSLAARLRAFVCAPFRSDQEALWPSLRSGLAYCGSRREAFDGLYLHGRPLEAASRSPREVAEAAKAKAVGAAARANARLGEHAHAIARSRVRS